MGIDAKRSRQSFQKVSRELTKLTHKPVPESVHKFRTNSRRVEAILTELVPHLSRNDKKLLKLLMRLRKKAGRVRDLDVQVAALRNLKVPESNGDKKNLIETLVGERHEREKKLEQAFDRETATEIRKRLKRAAGEMNLPKNANPLALTLHRLAELDRDHAPLSEKALHEYRIVGKRARYISELVEGDPEAKRIVAQLKHMQDVIGDWHDWLKLTEKAEQLLGGIRQSALVAMLRNVTRAKFRESVDAVAETRAALSGKRRPVVSNEASPSRKPSSEQASKTAAA
jgi:CHAD domain-containing protein